MKDDKNKKIEEIKKASNIDNERDLDADLEEEEDEAGDLITDIYNMA